MRGTERWVDLLDPSPEEITRHLPEAVHDRAMEQLLLAPAHDDDPRPKFEGHGDYIFGIMLIAVSVNDEDSLYFQEVDLVLTRERLVTVRKTPVGGRAPYDPKAAVEACTAQTSPGMLLYHLVDDIAERYLDLVDDIGDEIEELEDGIDHWSPEKIRTRIADLRHDMLHVRRTLAPMRDAVRQIVDDRIEFTGEEVFPRETELNFAAAYDKLLRATDGLELARDLIAGARDFHQAKVANDQNEVMKKFTVITSTVLLPSFIVGLYGQNFADIPELHWHYGYAYGWALIVAVTVAQLSLFKRKGWL